MFNKGLLLKVIFGGLLALAAGTGVAYMAFVKPYAPADMNVTIDNIAGSCEPVISFRDNSMNEDEFRLYRWNPPNYTYTLILIIHSGPGKGTLYSYTDSALPPGTYFYKVGAYNKFGETFSDEKSAAVNDSFTCAQVPFVNPADLPLNPFIESLTIINDCSVRISYRDNATNEQGLKIYRRDTSFTLIKTLGPHAGIPGTYDDNTKLPGGRYGYRIFAFNQKGDAGSNYIEIDIPPDCNPAVKSMPTKAPLALPTLHKLSTEACTWQAAANVFLRKGPDDAMYDRLVDVETGKSFPIIGQSEDGQFWVVEVAPGVAGYITKSEKYSLTNGDCSSVPTLKDPPPEIYATPTKKTGGNNNQATACPPGAVCP